MQLKRINGASFDILPFKGDYYWPREVSIYRLGEGGDGGWAAH